MDDQNTSLVPVTDQQLIVLSHMPQQLHAWAADDDWTGIVDRRERRKLQNRQNQRKWRQRKKASWSSVSPTEGETASVRELALTTPSTSTTHHFPQDRNRKQDQSGKLCPQAPPHAVAYLTYLETSMRNAYLTNSPCLDHLLGLTRLNVHHAIRENIAAIGMSNEFMCPDDAISIFNVSPEQPGFDVQKIPVALRPTVLQREKAHHPWLDFFPFPVMRDTLILASLNETKNQDSTSTSTPNSAPGFEFDDEDLCHDLMAFWDTHNTQATLVVWGQSWDPGNWEVSEGFVRKWGWLLRGCPELLASTNYWRGRRGERRISWGKLLKG